MYVCVHVNKANEMQKGADAVTAIIEVKAISVRVYLNIYVYVYI